MYCDRTSAIQPKKEKSMAKDLGAESVLSRLGVKFRYEAELPIESISQSKPHQVRNDAHLAPQAEVNKYAQLLTAGADFPPVLVTANEKAMLDGNTRVAAFRKVKRQTIPAYLCEVRSPRVGRTIAVAMNAKAGNRMSKAEIVEWVRGLNGDLPSDDEFTLYTGFAARTLRRIIQAKNFDERAVRLGVVPQYEFVDTVKTKLEGIELDSVFSALTVLVQDAGMDSAETGELVKTVAAATSEEQKLAIIEEQRQARATLIEERRAGFNPHLSKVARLVNMHGGWLINNAPVGGLDDPNSESREATRRKLIEIVESVQFALKTNYGTSV
jgi:hypothetical protein